MEFTKRKKIMVLGALALVLTITVANNRLQNGHDLTASSDYVNYEEKQMEEHNGDVLVDSLNLSQVPGTMPKEKEKDEKKAEKAAVVTSDDYGELSNGDTYFEEAKATLNMDRDKVVSMLTEVIAETPEGQEKNNATQQKLKIIDYMNKEKTIEALIKGKGYTDALVVITDSSISVTINKKTLEQKDIAKICDIVIRETGRSANQIVIQSKA
ncbi:MAG: SpoIIIAH-like family protein [Anaerovorax sp.]